MSGFSRRYADAIMVGNAIAASQASQDAALAASGGSALLGFLTAGAGAAARTGQGKLRDAVSVKDFGALGNGVADDTAAIQAALTFAERVSIAPEDIRGDVEVIFPPGRYLVSTLNVGVRVSLRSTGGVLAPLEYVTARAFLVKFNGHNTSTALKIDMNYAANYDTAIWCRGRYMDHINSEIWRAKCAWLIGDPAWEGVAASGALGDSEISITGGSAIWCVTVARAYGLNTIVHFGGGWKGYSYKWSLAPGDPRKAAWEALPEIGFIACGALVYFNGTALANFSGAQPLMLAKIQIVAAVDYKNSFGKFVVRGTHIESGYHFEAADPGAVPAQDAETKMLQMDGCMGYISAGRGGNLVNGGASKQGIDIRASNFYGNVTGALVYCVFGKVHVAADSYEQVAADFFQSLTMLMPSNYADFCFLNATTSAQALTGVPATLKPTVIAACDLTPGAAASFYVPATGIFTAPTLMRSVEIAVGLGLALAAGTDESDVFLYVNGAQVAIQAAIGPLPVLRFQLRRLAKGDTVEVRVAVTPSRTLNGTAATSLVITGSC